MSTSETDDIRLSVYHNTRGAMVLQPLTCFTTGEIKQIIDPNEDAGAVLPHTHATIVMITCDHKPKYMWLVFWWYDTDVSVLSGSAHRIDEDTSHNMVFYTDGRWANVQRDRVLVTIDDASPTLLADIFDL